MPFTDIGDGHFQIKFLGLNFIQFFQSIMLIVPIISDNFELFLTAYLFRAKHWEQKSINR